MANSGPSDEDVSNFLAFTGSSDVSKAASYLEMAGGNLETAVSLFMDHAGGGPSAPGMGGVAGGSGNNDSDWFGADSGGAAASANTMGDVRAPDATQRMRLMDDGHNPMRSALLAASGGGPTFMGEENFSQSIWGQGGGDSFDDDNDTDDNEDAMLATAVAMSRTASTAASQGSAVESGSLGIEQPGASAAATSATLSARAMTNRAAAAGNATAQPPPTADRLAYAAPSLKDMFAAPPYVHRGGGFQGARNVAKSALRWLLVNIQNDENFACHALNRDVWADELVTNLVQEGFIFWQAKDNSQDGSTYVTRYKVQAFPHIGIIDPRTGRLMWRKEGWTQENPMTAEGFAEAAADFCSRHSFSKPPAAPPMGGTSRSAVAKSPTKRPISDMTEDEQLQAALRASMNGGGGGDDDDNSMQMDDDGGISIGDSSQEDSKLPPAEAKDIEAGAKKKQATTMADEFEHVQVDDEPSASEAGVVRMQLRLPDGRRIVRRFRETDSVSVIFAFVLSQLDEAKAGRPFELRFGFPPRDLYTQLGETIENCKLAGGQVMASWKTDS